MSKTIKLDYDKVQMSYTKLIEIYDETDASHLAIKNAVSFAKDEMKGMYGAGFKEVSKIVLENLEDSIKDIKDIAENIEIATSEILGTDMVLSQKIAD
ncbi:hypothetical protein [uncultured Clostridium sp.]|jgi:hypothetical protein|uniref:hypothetical protein n=1 Tax=uncultured Clostridium sp. TaxID=59620 RepID=UPI00262D19B0|nr:hypothetical protein [uncultured Clostridium sp.]